MKPLLTVAAALAMAATSAAWAVPLTFTSTICTMDSSELKAEVVDLAEKVERTRRVMAPASQYRKHVERHYQEVLDVLSKNQAGSSCPEQRKELLAQLRTDLAELDSHTSD